LKVTLSLATAALVVLVSSPAIRAAEISEKTACGVVVTAFDRQDSIPEIVTTITNVMQTLDDTHTSAGEPGVLAPLSDQGMSSIIAVAIEDCRDNPRKRLRDAAAKAYMGLRAMELMFGSKQ
jgi:hypothetical protein